MTPFNSTRLNSTWHPRSGRRQPSPRSGAGHRSRPGFTVMEMMMVIIVAGILLGSMCTLAVTCTKTYATEMRQNEMNWRSRSLTPVFSEDIRSGIKVVWASSAAYTLPSGPTYLNDKGQVVASIAGATKLLVIQLPSYDSTGKVISGSYDYVGYAYSQTAQTLTRTCVITQGSSRPAYTGAIPGAGLYQTNLNFLLLHDGSVGGNGALVDPFSGSVNLTDMDEVCVNTTVQATTWNTQLHQNTSTCTQLRNWHLGPH